MRRQCSAASIATATATGRARGGAGGASGSPACIGSESRISLTMREAELLRARDDEAANTSTAWAVCRVDFEPAPPSTPARAG